MLSALARACCSRTRSQGSLPSFRTVSHCNRCSLGNGRRLGRDGLLDKRSILRKGPLQNRWNPLSTPSSRRRLERALSHLTRLEPILARFHRYSGRELRSRMDLEEVLLMSDMARADDVRNYPDNALECLR